jgi:hypothetical protein
VQPVNVEQPPALPAGGKEETDLMDVTPMVPASSEHGCVAVIDAMVDR